MDLLKRDLAPIVPAAWDEIDKEARRALPLELAGRKLVDFSGPHGWGFAAVNTGRLRPVKGEPARGAAVGSRVVQPLIEVRVPFTLAVGDLDDVARGAADVNLAAVVSAAEKIAGIEDGAIFNGYKEAGIAGIIESSPHKPLTLPSPEKYPAVIVEAREILRDAGIDGPYALALSPQSYKEISRATEDGYPIRKRIDGQIVDGPLVRAPAIQGAVLLSMRGGDFELTVGQDLSIGYTSHTREAVELFIAESFTFRILEAAAAIHLRAGK